jgi:hypothetical protein
MSTIPAEPVVDHPSRSTKEYVSKQDEMQQVQAFLGSLPTYGISVNVYPGNNMEAVEKKLRRKVNSEGLLVKFRESKVRIQAPKSEFHCLVEHSPSIKSSLSYAKIMS